MLLEALLELFADGCLALSSAFVPNKVLSEKYEKNSLPESLTPGANCDIIADENLFLLRKGVFYDLCKRFFRRDRQ